MKKTTDNPEAMSFERQEHELAAVLSAYRESVHTWSANLTADLLENSRARSVAYRQGVKAPSAWSILTWRFATFAFSGVLLASVVTGGVIQHEHNVQEAQRIEKQKADDKKLADLKIEEEKKIAANQLTADQNQQDDELLADVDSDVAQDSPAAMEPLATLMSK